MLQRQKKSRPMTPPGRLSGLELVRTAPSVRLFCGRDGFHTTISRIPQLRQNHIHSFGEWRGTEAGRTIRSNRCVPWGFSKTADWLE